MNIETQKCNVSIKKNVPASFFHLASNPCVCVQAPKCMSVETNRRNSVDLTELSVKSTESRRCDRNLCRFDGIALHGEKHFFPAGAHIRCSSLYERAKLKQLWLEVHTISVEEQEEQEEEEES